MIGKQQVTMIIGMVNRSCIVHQVLIHILTVPRVVRPNNLPYRGQQNPSIQAPRSYVSDLVLEQMNVGRVQRVVYPSLFAPLKFCSIQMEW